MDLWYCLFFFLPAVYVRQRKYFKYFGGGLKRNICYCSNNDSSHLFLLSAMIDKREYLFWEIETMEWWTGVAVSESSSWPRIEVMNPCTHPTGFFTLAIQWDYRPLHDGIWPRAKVVDIKMPMELSLLQQTQRIGTSNGGTLHRLILIIDDPVEKCLSTVSSWLN